jgi:hypothetical protein
MPTEITEAVRPIRAEVPTAGLHEVLPITDPVAEPQDTGVLVVAPQDTGVLVVDLQAQGVPDTGVQEAEVAPGVRGIAEVLEAVHEDPACEALAVLPDLPEVEDPQEAAEAAAEGINHPNVLIS